MIVVRRVREPTKFDGQVRRPGIAWLRTHPSAKRPRNLWSPFLPDLERGFRGLCGYAAMLDPTGGTVDHYVSLRDRPDLAYEWKNYRFASQTLNALKANADDKVLDPYSVGEGWFEVLLPSLQLQITPAVPPRERALAEYTLHRLKLRDGERIVRWRRRWYAMYQTGKLSLEGLEDVAPLIAAAVWKQQGMSQTGRKPKQARLKR